ncbi:MAG: protein-arginine deiminase family protein [Myxococcota bacterium]
MRWSSCLMLAALVACSSSADADKDDAPSTTSETDAPADTDPGDEDTDTDSDKDTDEDVEPAEFSAPDEVAGVPNIDDDNQNNRSDWRDGWKPNFEDDYAEMVITPRPLGFLTGVEGIRLELMGNVQQLRIWQEGDADTPVLGGGTNEVVLPYSEEPLVLYAEFKDFLTSGILTVSEVNADGEPFLTHDITLIAAPMLLNHHLQPADMVYAVEVGASWWGPGNDNFIDGLSDALGPNHFTPVNGNQYGQDVWMQDEFEFANVTGAQGEAITVVIDSIRDRGLDDFSENALEGADVAGVTFGSGWGSSQDSFGNLETSPPLTAGGISYPFGRTYYGSVQGNYGMHPQMEQALDDQLAQAPFQLDTRFLCVGHIDEVTSFIPDPTAPRGFRFVMADIDEGIAVLESMDPNTSLPMYQGGQSHGISDVDEMLNDAALLALNEELRDDWLEPMLETFIQELELTEDEILRLPSYFEVAPQCGGATASLIPGMVNLQVADVADGSDPHIFLADPFMRSNTNNQAGDAFIDAVTDLFPEALQLHFIDDFSTYHLALGEVHCGTNVVRAPDPSPWWDVARDLLGLPVIKKGN